MGALIYIIIEISLISDMWTTYLFFMGGIKYNYVPLQHINIVLVMHDSIVSTTDINTGRPP